MKRTLQKHGNSQALVIETPLMEATGITMETPLEVTVSGDTITIRPANVGVSREVMAESLERVFPRYEQMLKNLAK
jgi:antitoxin component of MazEF toxin-antitoxin module